MTTLPAEAERILNEMARSTDRPKKSKRVFIVVPNMASLNIGLVAKLFQFAMQREYDPWFHFLTEKRHADFARNLAAQAFLESSCQICCMIDHDVDPHKDLLSLVELDKHVIAGNVFCWINGELMSSIWQRAECEQCRNLRAYMETGKVLDDTQYKIVANTIVPTGMLARWNPFSNAWEKYATKEGVFGELKCRCKGTGYDPWVFRTHQNLTLEPTKVDSVGSAAFFIKREVFEKTPFPWFRFLYRESGEILMTEDHYFCWKAQECGFEIWASAKHFCSHYKTVDLLQLTSLSNRAYSMGREHEKVKQSIVIPEEVSIALS